MNLWTLIALAVLFACSMGGLAEYLGRKRKYEAAIACYYLIMFAGLALMVAGVKGMDL